MKRVSADLIGEKEIGDAANTAIGSVLFNARKIYAELSDDEKGRERELPGEQQLLFDALIVEYDEMERRMEVCAVR